MCVCVCVCVWWFQTTNGGEAEEADGNEEEISNLFLQLKTEEEATSSLFGCITFPAYAYM